MYYVSFSAHLKLNRFKTYKLIYLATSTKALILKVGMSVTLREHLGCRIKTLGVGQDFSLSVVLFTIVFVIMDLQRSCEVSLSETLSSFFFKSIAGKISEMEQGLQTLIRSISKSEDINIDEILEVCAVRSPALWPSLFSSSKLLPIVA